MNKNKKIVTFLILSAVVVAAAAAVVHSYHAVFYIFCGFVLGSYIGKKLYFLKERLKLKRKIKITKTLDKFLKKHDACEESYEFAKDLTLEQFLDTCNREDWILWLFQRMNPEDKRLRVLAAGHCSNTVRHLMRDERSTKAVDIAIAYGEGRATKEELEEATFAAAFAAEAAYSAGRKNQKQTADICRKYLPIELWNQKKI
jgi:hypothetical protein